jgi:hypothetical protein
MKSASLFPPSFLFFINYFSSFWHFILVIWLLSQLMHTQLRPSAARRPLLMRGLSCSQAPPPPPLRCIYALESVRVHTQAPAPCTFSTAARIMEMHLLPNELAEWSQLNAIRRRFPFCMHVCTNILISGIDLVSDKRNPDSGDTLSLFINALQGLLL